MKIDLHLHTHRYSECGCAGPEEMLEASLAAGLDGVVFTEHHTYWPEDELEEMRERFPSLLILSGVEITTPEGDLLVYGNRRLSGDLEGTPMMQVLAETCGDEFFRAVAHPFRYDRSLEHYDLLSGIPFDGVEVASSHTNEPEGRLASRLAADRGLVKRKIGRASCRERV